MLGFLNSSKLRFTPLENAQKQVARPDGLIQVRGLMPRASSLTGLTIIGLIAIVATVIAVYLYFNIPIWYFNYNTGINLPSHLSEQERKQFADRWHEILNMPDRGRNDSLLYNDIGILRSGYGDYKGAIQAFKLARSKNPQDARFSRNTAIAYTNLNNYAEAEKAFREAFRLAPTQPEYWLELGELYIFKIQNKEKARLFYIEALQRSNQNLDVVKSYANFLGDIEKDYTEAIKYWQILADNDEKNRVDYLAKIEELKLRISTP